MEVKCDSFTVVSFCVSI